MTEVTVHLSIWVAFSDMSLCAYDLLYTVSNLESLDEMANGWIER